VGLWPVPTPATYREYLQANDTHESVDSLRSYVGTLPGEWWRSEFKTCSEDGTYVVRNPVAALANTRGGEVFVGVRDADQQFVGTRLRAADLPDRLRQPGAVEEWYSLDLMATIANVAAVAIPEGDRRVLVLEVTKSLRPLLVEQEDHSLAWLVREGGRNRALQGVEWVRRLREQSRGKLLLELYREYDSAVQAIPTILNFHDLAPDLFRLPRYESALADGTAYTTLDSADRRLLIAQDPQPSGGFAAPGLLNQFLREGARVRSLVEQDVQRNNWPTETRSGNELRVTRGTLIQHYLPSFQNYLQGLGLIPSNP
jgi:hypothetical protein